eukprot:gene405-biopygen302
MGGCGVVAPPAGSELVERANNLAEPYEDQAPHRCLPVCIQKPRVVDRTRRLWILLECNDIKLQARYIRIWVQQREALADEVVIMPRSGQLLTPTQLGGYNLRKAKQATVAAQQPQLATGSKVRVYWPIDDTWYSGTAEASMQFSVAEGRSWLPAMEPTVRLYIAPQMSKAAIKAAIFPPSTAPTRTWGLPQAVKGMSSLQVREPGGLDGRSRLPWEQAKLASA